jgi:hypothetical protein
MKLSISLPDSMAREIKKVADQSGRGVSWWLQRAWEAGRTVLLRDESEAVKSHRRAMKALSSLRGVLKKDFPNMDSVTLAHRAFLIKK